MDDGAIPLASDFPPGDAAAWMALVEKTLDGQAFDKRLVTRTYDGLPIEPLYTAANSTPPLTLAQTPREDGRWDIRVGVDHPDPVQANAIALEALEGGAHSILLSIDPTGETGVAIGSVADLDQILRGVLIDLAPVALDAGSHGIPVAHWLMEIAEARTLNARLALHIDPLSAFAATGVAPGGIARQINAGAELVKIGRAETVFLASGQIMHEAGGGEAAELGFAMASALAYAKAAIDTGAEPAQAFDSIALGLAVNGEYFTTIAKLRAMRAVWARITEAATGKALTARIEARSSRRMLAVLDPWVNMLRLSAAGFAAATGGADAIVLDAFSQPLGRPTAFARRQARNAQLVLMEESRLGAVADPAAGAWYIETLSRKLAEAAWTFMQKIERAGGAAVALENGLLIEAIETTRAARAADIAKRKTGLIGVSEFPDLAEAGVELDLVDFKPFAKPAPPPLRGTDSRCAPLTPHRSAEPFEKLRRRAAALKARPKVFLATLGTPADYSGRTGFAHNLFAAGGIAAEVGEAPAYDPTEAAIAVICSSDALYADGAAAAAQSLKAAGAKRIYLAGRPGDLQPSLKAAGVDAFLFAGMDAVAALDEALMLVETRR